MGVGTATRRAHLRRACRRWQSITASCRSTPTCASRIPSAISRWCAIHPSAVPCGSRYPIRSASAAPTAVCACAGRTRSTALAFAPDASGSRMNRRRVVITGTGAVCAAGRDPASILEAIRAGRSAIGPIRQWDAAQWPMQAAGEIPDLKPRDMVEDRKLHKLIRRTDLFGLYAADRAIDASGLAAHRAALELEAAVEYNDRTGVYVGSGGGSYE